MKKHRFAICAALVLIAFTTYISLDTFVISRGYDTNATGMNLALFDTMGNSQEATDAGTSSDSGQQETASVKSQETITSGQAEEDSAQEDAALQGTSERGHGGRGAAKFRPGARSQWPGDGFEGKTSKNADTTPSGGSKSYESGSGAPDTSGSGTSDNTTSDELSSTPSGSAAPDTSGSGTSDNTTSDELSSTPSGSSPYDSPGTGTADTATGENVVTTDNYTITLSEYYENNTRIYVADVTLTSAQYLKTALANDTYGKNVTATTSSIARTNNAILAINGDYYGVQESGYVIRNGIVYRGTAKGSDVLCLYANGTMEIVSDRDYTAEELVENGVWQAFTFGPGLVEEGAVTVGYNTEVGKAMASNPRTAIGLIDTNHFVFVVSDGRTSESEGLSLYELATFMQGLGVKTAYNLDGGGSSTMYFNGAVVNRPTTGGSIKERSVSDIIYI